MLLAVDLGNTHVALGVYDGREQKAHWRLQTDKDATSYEILIQVKSLISILDEGDLDITEAIVSSVVPKVTAEWIKALNHLFGNKESVYVVNSRDDYGIQIKYANPEEIGADRICDAVAAQVKYGAPCIVVDLGTATNIEVIDHDGAFLGGIIAPGLISSAEALFSKAARLSQIEIEIPEKVIGNCTANAVKSGLTYGEVDRIDGLVNRIKDEIGHDATVIATGGMHKLILPISRTIDVSDGSLTLDGLQIIHERMFGL